MKSMLVADTANLKKATFTERVYVRAKITIFGHMLEEGQKEIALKYLKKVIFDHNRNPRVQALLLEKTTKLMLQGRASEILSIQDFTRKVLRDVAFEKTTEKTFEHLKTNAMLRNLPVQDFVEIYEAKLLCAAFSKDVGTWVEYHGCLIANRQHLEAKRVLERALQVVDDKQAVLTCCKQ